VHRRRLYGNPSHRSIPQKREGLRALKLGDKVHSDAWGPTNTQSYDGKESFVSFTDYHDRWTYLVPMAKKSDAFGCNKQYQAWIETQHEAKIKHLQNELGGEYLSEAFTAHLHTSKTEGEPVTQNSQHVTPHKQPPPQPQAPTGHIDLLDKFETLGAPAEQLQHRGHQVQKPSAYVCGITEGTGSSTGHVNVPTYPQGLPMPTESSALPTLVELGRNAPGTEGEMYRPFGFSMVAAARDAGVDLTSLNDAHVG
jgi:hypothetical protein